MGFLTMNEALLYPARSAEFEVGSKNVMSVDVPTLTYTGATADDAAQVPYSFAFTTGELDTAVTELTTCLPDLLELAEVEKTCNMLADEIEKDPPASQRPGICHDPGNAGKHQVHHHEAQRKRKSQHRTPDESQGNHGETGVKNRVLQVVCSTLLFYATISVTIDPAEKQH